MELNNGWHDYLELPADLELPTLSSSSWSRLSAAPLPAGSPGRGRGGPNVVGILSVLCENFGELESESLVKKAIDVKSQGVRDLHWTGRGFNMGPFPNFMNVDISTQVCYWTSCAEERGTYSKTYLRTRLLWGYLLVALLLHCLSRSCYWLHRIKTTVLVYTALYHIIKLDRLGENIRMYESSHEKSVNCICIRKLCISSSFFSISDTLVLLRSYDMTQ